MSSLEHDLATSQSCQCPCTPSILTRIRGPWPLTGTDVTFIYSVRLPLSHIFAILPAGTLRLLLGTTSSWSGAELLLKIASLLRTYLPTSAQEISTERTQRTPRVQEIPQAPSALSIPCSRAVKGPRLHHVWRAGFHTFVADKLPEEV